MLLGKKLGDKKYQRFMDQEWRGGDSLDHKVDKFHHKGGPWLNTDWNEFPVHEDSDVVSNWFCNVCKL